jgi:protein TonB
MYRPSLDARDRSGAIIAVVAVHAALVFVLLNLAGKVDLPPAQSVLRVFDFRDVPPPPPAAPPPQRTARNPSHSPGGSPPNLKSEGTSVVVVPTPPVSQPSPVAVATVPAQGTASTQGAAAVAGAGTGTGGQGNGTGSGTGSGAGSGDAVSSPQLVTPVLRGRDFPRDLLDRWPRGTPVFLRLRIDAQGIVGECIVDRGTGVAAIDSEMCNLVHQRLRFRPALNRSGQAVAGWFGYGQTPPR